MKIDTKTLVEGMLNGTPEFQAELAKIKLLGGKLLGCGCGSVIVLGPDVLAANHEKLGPDDQMTYACTLCGGPLFSQTRNTFTTHQYSR